MQSTRSLLIALLSALAAAQDGPNAFKVPTNFSATAGEPLALKWGPTTDGTVSLVLRSGSSNNLEEGTVIASNIDNSGSYTWTPDAHLTRGSDYTIEIVDDSDPSQVNYSPYFVLDSDNTVAYSTSQVTLGASAASSALPTSTASPTGSATSLVSALSTSTASSGTSASSGAAANTNSASSTSDGSDSSSTMSSDMSSMTGSATTTGSMSATDSGAGFQSTASESASAETQSEGAAPRVTAFAGLVGMAALGALAL